MTSTENVEKQCLKFPERFDSLNIIALKGLYVQHWSTLFNVTTLYCIDCG